MAEISLQRRAQPGPTAWEKCCLLGKPGFVSRTSGLSPHSNTFRCPKPVTESS